MLDYEKLGAFYLGARYDLAAGKRTTDLLLYDSKDLVTHAVVVGMTGSGKTGLCLSLLEEAALDGVPAIVIDPKGDLGNLLLTFPELRPSDFRPWIDESEAQRQGISADDLAAVTAERWKTGLAEWSEDGARIARFRDAVDLTIYTPGSNSGLPLSVLRSFNAPPRALLEDAEAFRDRVNGSVSGLLALLSIEADPLRSREHILLSNLISDSWRAGRDLDLGGLIAAIQSPPFDKIGVLSLDAFYPPKERFELALLLNNLLAAPGFATWMEGEPLDAGCLLYTPAGKPRISILSIAHLSDAERMFVVTLLLNEVLAWMRAQPGTTSLRALLYMDEVFGYFPPTANPPCKQPMLTLLKQARAFGLGIVLATQNPVDLDYKGLANAGSWFLGRLQTERDKARVLEGLEGASAAAGAKFDRAAMEATLAGLKSRVFLMNNVHDDAPTLFHTRWTLSYLRGPMTRAQIQNVMAEKRAASAAAMTAAPVSTSPSAAAPTSMNTPSTPSSPRSPSTGTRRAAPDAAPPDVPVLFLSLEETGVAERFYRPHLYGFVRMHYAQVKSAIDQWEDLVFVAPLLRGAGEVLLPINIWEQALEHSPAHIRPTTENPADATFDELPAEAGKSKSFLAWNKALVEHLYKNRALRLWQYVDLKQCSRPEESEAEFRLRLAQLLRERRDQEIEKLRQKHAPAVARLEERIRAAEARRTREQSEFKEKQMDAALSVGASVLGALFGGRRASLATGARRAASGLRGANRAARQKDDVVRAEESLEVLVEQRSVLEQDVAAKLAALSGVADASAIAIEELLVRPKKTEIQVAQLAVLWIEDSGRAERP